MGMVYSLYAAIFGGNDVDNGTPDPATGLTPKEKEAIRASWAIIADKKAIRVHGVEFFVMLFEEYPYMLTNFNAFKGMTSAQLRKDRAMYSHALTVMYSIGSLVENLDDADQLLLLINKIANNHLARDVGYKYFKDLADTFIIFLENKVGSADTPFIKQSWAKFLGVMNSVVEKMEKEQST